MFRSRAERREPEPRGFLGRAAKWLLLAALAPLVALGAVSLVGFVARTINPGPGSVSDQLTEIIRQGPGNVAFNRRVDLHGTLENSYVLVFRAADPLLRLDRPDELRIYDEDDGVLELRFRFRPAAEPVRAAKRLRPNPGLQFDIERLGDLDGNGSQEIIASISSRAMGPYEPRPVVVAWQGDKDKYAVVPVLDARNASRWGGPPGSQLGYPPLVKRFKPGDYAEGSRERYLTPDRVFDRQGRISFLTYSVEDYIVRRGRDSYVVIAGFTVAARAHVDNPTIMQVYAYALDEIDPPSFYQCSSGGPRTPPTLVRPRPFEGVDAALDRTWRRIRSRVFC